MKDLFSFHRNVCCCFLSLASSLIDNRKLARHALCLCKQKFTSCVHRTDRRRNSSRPRFAVKAARQVKRNSSHSLNRAPLRGNVDASEIREPFIREAEIRQFNDLVIGEMTHSIARSWRTDSRFCAMTPRAPLYYFTGLEIIISLLLVTLLVRAT